MPLTGCVTAGADAVLLNRRTENPRPHRFSHLITPLKNIKDIGSLVGEVLRRGDLLRRR